jgi:hypothetical protein
VQEQQAHHAEDRVRQPHRHRHRHATAERHALEKGVENVVGATTARLDPSASVRPPLWVRMPRKADQDEDEGGHGQREALVQLHLERRHDLPLALELGDRFPEHRERHFLLGFFDALGRPLRVVERQVEVVEAERGEPEAPGVARVGLADGAVDEAHGDPTVLRVREEASFARDDDPGKFGVAFVGDWKPPQGDLQALMSSTYMTIWLKEAVKVRP